MKNLKFLAVLLIALITACSSGGKGEKAFSGKNLAITVSGSRSFNPNIIHGRIDYYLITITAQDLNTPFTQRFGGDSESATMLGIPTGTGRTILVEAYNPNGLVIRRGQQEGVAIVPNLISHVEIVMHSVPIFTNVTDKSVVNTPYSECVRRENPDDPTSRCLQMEFSDRLQLSIFGDPNSQLEVLHRASDTWETCVDLATSNALIKTSSDEGLFDFIHADPGYGVHTFQVRDRETEEASEVTITLNETMTRPGIAINSGGYVKQQGDELVLVGVGQPHYRGTEVDGEDLGGDTLIDVVEMLY